MKILMFVLVALVICGCSTDTSPIAGSRAETVPKGLFGHAGMGGGIALLDDAGRPVRADAGRPGIPSGTSDGGPIPAADAGAADASPTADSGPAADAGPAPDAAPSGVAVCGTCSATDPCAPGLLCVDEAAAGLSTATGQQAHRCYIECGTYSSGTWMPIEPGLTECDSTYGTGSCVAGIGTGSLGTTAVCPTQPHTHKSGC